MHKLESPVLIVIQDTENNVSFYGNIQNALKIYFKIRVGFWCFNLLFPARLRPLLRYGRIFAVQIQSQLQSFPLERRESVLYQG